jgi:hypothetical protein
MSCQHNAEDQPRRLHRLVGHYSVPAINNAKGINHA